MHCMNKKYRDKKASVHWSAAETRTYPQAVAGRITDHDDWLTSGLSTRSNRGAMAALRSWVLTKGPTPFAPQ